MNSNSITFIKNFVFRSCLILLLGLFTLTTVHAQDTKAAKKAENAKFNEKCFKCHGQSKYKYDNPESGTVITK